jgi:hypothetical protein
MWRSYSRYNDGVQRKRMRAGSAKQEYKSRKAVCLIVPQRMRPGTRAASMHLTIALNAFYHHFSGMTRHAHLHHILVGASNRGGSCSDNRHRSHCCSMRCMNPTSISMLSHQDLCNHWKGEVKHNPWGSNAVR